MQPLGESLASMVEQAQGVDQDTLGTTDATLTESIPNSSTALSSSRSTPFAALVLIARVQS